MIVARNWDVCAGPWFANTGIFDAPVRISMADKAQRTLCKSGHWRDVPT